MLFRSILYRTNAQSLGFESEFLHRKIPYTVVGSLKFYEREEIKDALAYLALFCYTMCMDKYIHGRTCVYNINYHIVWCVKYRRKVLNDDISSRLYEIVENIGNEKGFSVVQCKVGENDHIHCFVTAPPKLSITDIVRWLKGISGRRILMEFPEIQKQLWKGNLWNGSYFVETIGSTSEENIKRYIENQKTHQL